MPVSKTYVVGLTGGIGCGKTEAAKYLASLGAAHIDADAISRELTAEGGEALPEIRRVFGDGMFDQDGNLLRRKLGDAVFNDPASKRALEGIIHPLVQRRVMDGIDEASNRGVRVTILDVPLLFETGMDVLCDETWTMSADPRVQLERIRTRDGLTDEQAQARIANQLSMQERNARATQVIDSDRPIEKTRAELNQLYQQLIRRL